MILNRTAYGIANKNNTPIDIDETINLYGINYYLSAAIIHCSLTVHYWTLAKRGNNIWMELNDRTSKKISYNDRKEQMNGKKNED